MKVEASVQTPAPVELRGRQPEGARVRTFHGKPGPWFRSRLFMFGLVGLVLLGSMWVVSLKQEVSVAVPIGGSNYFLGWTPHWIEFTVIGPGASSVAPLSATGRYWPDLLAEKYPPYPPIVQDFGPVYGSVRGLWGHRYGIAIWLVGLFYVLFWTWALLRWQRRKWRLYREGLPEGDR